MADMSAELRPSERGVLFTLLTLAMWMALAVPVAVVAYLTLPDPPADLSQGWGSDPLDYWPESFVGLMFPWALIVSMLASAALLAERRRH